MTKNNTSRTLGALPGIKSQYFPEPPLLFAEKREHIDPKYGLSCFGPYSRHDPDKHPASVKVGFIGSSESIATSQEWISRMAEGVMGNQLHVSFPGYTKEVAFGSELYFHPNWNATITRAELEALGRTKNSRQAFEATLATLEEKVATLARKDQPPSYIVLALPESVLKKSRVVDYYDPKAGKIHRDLRRAFKAMAMKYRIPTQLLRQETVTTDWGDYAPEVPWSFFSGLYFKAGGVPWAPVGLQPGTCYMGISFYRPLEAIKNMRTSLVQAFDEHGQGLVLRGPEFLWAEDEEGTRSPHLTASMARTLVEMVLKQYKLEMGQPPQRIVVHKSSRYWPAEREGFEAALQDHVTHYDLIALEPQSQTRLIPPSKYPPLRGTRFKVEDIDYLYTTGFIAELSFFRGPHVPTPLQIADHIGFDTSRGDMMREILTLTKMNWNAAQLGGLLPITLRFSRLVSDIMREIPTDREPLPNFKFYM